MRQDRRSFLMAGAGAGTALLLGTRSLLAAPVQQAEEAQEDPWESGACDVPEQDDSAFDDDQLSGEDAGDENEIILPVRVLIPGIEVNARVEVLEIVGDVLQDPTNGEAVAWYKETGRPGEEGNAVIAGHLNWYNMPEGVFFAINQLQEGDEVLVRDTACREFRYLVEWVELVEVANADMEDITGPSEQALLTLITCGGTWDPSISEYRERTVVRARLDGEPLPSSSDENEGDEADDDASDDANAENDLFGDTDSDHSDAGNDNDLGDAGSDDDLGDPDTHAGDGGSPQIEPRD
jgi:LPXTG-site transpeptidase (sortase) family protein